MAHVNGQIPTIGEDEQWLYTARLEAEVKFWRDRSKSLERELRNIPCAIYEYGYWECEGRDGEIIKLTPDNNIPVTNTDKE